MRMISMPDGSAIRADLIVGFIIIKAAPKSKYSEERLPYVSVLYLRRFDENNKETTSLCLTCKTNTGAKRLVKKLKDQVDSAMLSTILG